MIAKAVALLLLLAALSGPAIEHAVAAGGSGTTSAPTITVQGSGEIGVAPDQAVITLNINRFAPLLDAAKRANDASTTRIFELLGRYGVQSRDIQTQKVSMDILREPSERDEDFELRYSRPIRGYLVSRKMIVQLKDLRRFEAFYAEVLQSADCEVGNVVLETSQPRKYRDMAREQAIRAAREKATAMATALGQTIGKAVDITEEVDRYGSASNSSVEVGAYVEDTGLFAPGQVRVTATVNVTFVLN
jgi:hypothetical protein